MPCNMDSDTVVIPQSSAAIPRTEGAWWSILFALMYICGRGIAMLQQLMNLLQCIRVNGYYPLFSSYGLFLGV